MIEFIEKGDDGFDGESVGILTTIAGKHYFLVGSESVTGYLSSQELRAIADKLEELNNDRK